MPVLLLQTLNISEKALVLLLSVQNRVFEKAESVNPIIKVQKMEHKFGRNIHLRKYRIG
jgi:hypothetical protein